MAKLICGVTGILLPALALFYLGICPLVRVLASMEDAESLSVNFTFEPPPGDRNP